jgi:hypothetical protein
VDDSLARAAIEVIAVKDAVRVTGEGFREMVEIPAGRGLSLPANMSPPATMKLFEPRPIRGGVYAELVTGEEVELIPDNELASFDVGERIVYSMPGSQTVDLGRFQGVAAQAADHDLQLVIVAGGVPDGGS